MAGELESDSVALERVREYEELPQVKPFFDMTKDHVEKTFNLETENVPGGRLGVSGTIGRALAFNG